MNRRTGWMLAAMAALAASVAIVVLRFEVSGDVTAFLPEDDSDKRVEISTELARSGLGKGMIVLVSGPSAQVATATAKLAAELAASGHFEWVQSGLGEAREELLRELFFPARLGFISNRPSEIAAMLSDEGLATAAGRLKEALTGPLGPMVRVMVGADPLLLYKNVAERVASARPNEIDVKDGAFVTTALPVRGVIFAATKASPFAAAKQRRVIEEIERHAGHLGGDFSVAFSGVNVLAVDGERKARADITRISAVSLLATALLFLFCFRGVRAFAALFVPIGFGIAGGMAVSLVAFGSVHGMTLAFGATLIGVSVDYVVHYLTHQRLERKTPLETLTSVWPAIALGGITTIVGFVGMGLTSTPGMRQIATFGASGIGFALLATYALLPSLIGAPPATVGGLARVRRGLARGIAALEGRRGALGVASVAIAIVSLAVILRLDWDDNPRGLTATNPELMTRDENIRAAVSSADAGRFVVARGADWERALVANDAAARHLDDAVAANELGGYRSLHKLLWSRALQQENLDAVWGHRELAARTRAAMVAVGFREGAFREWEELLAKPKPQPINAELIVGGPLMPLLRGLFVEAEDGVMVLTQLTDVRDSRALRDRLAAVPGVTYFDQVEFLEDSYRGFRRRVLTVVCLSLVFVFLVVFARYRVLRLAVAAFAPACVAAASALAVLGAIGVTLNLLHVLGLMLVLSIGVDYGVFVVEASLGGGHVDVAIVGTAVSCATTLLGFGLLAMSDIPALSALGSVTAIGCLASFILAPTALAIVGKAAK